jgi:N-6 DNA Methylase
VSALVLANAMIFQEQLSLTNADVGPLGKMLTSTVAQNLQSQWNNIWNDINYISIFQLAESVIKELPATGHTQSALTDLAAEAIGICNQQTALRHDLMGRIYHWLLHYAKYLGAYYTNVSAATLLMKMVTSLPWGARFAANEALSSFKVADLACGTGTLLMASCQALLDELIKARYQTGLSLEWVDIQQAHKILMESTIHGYDVLPSAVHLTASTLALLAPEVAFIGMNLYVMPMGVDRKLKQLGSLEFIRGNETQTQIALDYTQVEAIKASASGSKVMNAKVPKADLFVMNPPFARSVGDNLLFGSLPDERAALHQN